MTKTKTKKSRAYQDCTRCHQPTTSTWNDKPYCVHHRVCGMCEKRTARQFLPKVKIPVCAACNMAWRRRG